MAAGKRKVYAYITCRDRLLLFRHVDFPEAGIQVPGGTVDAGEPYIDALFREVREETGLEGLVLAGLVGRQRFVVPSLEPMQIHHRRFYHLRLDGVPLERWQHLERHASDGSGPLAFEFWWQTLYDLPALAGEQDHCLPRLRRTMNLK